MVRASSAKGILGEDRMAILEMARDKAIRAVDRYKNNKNILKTYCDVGLEIFKRAADPTVFEDASLKLREAEARLGDPDITNSLIMFERQYSQIQSQSAEEDQP